MGALGSILISAIFTLVFTPLSIVFSYLIYQELKSIKGQEITPSSSRTPFILLAVLGLIAPIIIGLLVGFAMIASILTGGGFDYEDNINIPQDQQQQLKEKNKKELQKNYFN